MTKEHDISVFSNTLFKMGLAANKLDVYSEDFSQFIEVYKTNKTFKKFMLSPRINRKMKKEFINKVFNNSFSKEFLGFLAVIIVKKCQYLLVDIHDDFRLLVDKHKNILRAKVLSTQAISDKMMAEITNTLTKRFNKKIALTNVIDKKIIGGLVFKVGDIRVDISILKSLKIFQSNIESIKLKGAIQ